MEYITKLETFLDLYFSKKAPSLPANIKENIVKFAPYLIIVITIFSIPSLLIALGINTLSYPFAVAGRYAYNSFAITGLIFLLSIVLQVMAIPGLFKRSLSAWRLMFYSSLVSLVYQLFLFNLGGFIVSGIISFYCLFQIKSYYR